MYHILFIWMWMRQQFNIYVRIVKKRQKTCIFVHKFKHGRQRDSVWVSECPPLFFFITQTVCSCLHVCSQAYFFPKIWLCVVCIAAILKLDKIKRTLQGGEVKSIYEVLLTNNVYPRVLCITAKDTKCKKKKKSCFLLGRKLDFIRKEQGENNTCCIH